MRSRFSCERIKTNRWQKWRTKLPYSPFLWRINPQHHSSKKVLLVSKDGLKKQNKRNWTIQVRILSLNQAVEILDLNHNLKFTTKENRFRKVPQQKVLWKVKKEPVFLRRLTRLKSQSQIKAFKKLNRGKMLKKVTLHLLQVSVGDPPQFYLKILHLFWPTLYLK